MRIDYHNVDIAHNEHTILKSVDFQAAEGEFIYLIGKVGSGKSSLLKTMYGELDIRNGFAKVLDWDMNHLKRKHIPALRKRLGIVFQDFQLLFDRTVYDNLDFALKVTGWRKKADRKKRIEAVLKEVEMTDKAQKMPFELSGGEQQCICIARAILNQPDIILADEATGNLDMESSRRATSILHEISHKGTTVILSTHNENLIREFPGKVYHCNAGQLILSTTTKPSETIPEIERTNENN